MSEKLHMIKLVVGLSDLESFYRHQGASVTDYNGAPANIVYTRYKPKSADEILSSGGSIYRVLNRRILCRQKILGFEQVETKEKGTMCAIMTETDIVQTYAKPKRPFQGWRYLHPKDAPKDRGFYTGGGALDEVPPDLEADLIESGLL